MKTGVLAEKGVKSSEIAGKMFFGGMISQTNTKKQKENNTTRTKTSKWPRNCERPNPTNAREFPLGKGMILSLQNKAFHYFVSQVRL